MATWI